jgi:superfamily II DNA or RNA helicase
MSKTLYTQKLGRGMRPYKDKSHLMVFDFVDNANIFRMPYSMHRLLKLKDYKPGAYVGGESICRDIYKVN